MIMSTGKSCWKFYIILLSPINLNHCYYKCSSNYNYRKCNTSTNSQTVLDQSSDNAVIASFIFIFIFLHINWGIGIFKSCTNNLSQEYHRFFNKSCSIFFLYNCQLTALFHSGFTRLSSSANFSLLIELYRVKQTYIINRITKMSCSKYILKRLVKRQTKLQ